VFFVFRGKNNAGKSGRFVDLSKRLVQVQSSQLSLEASAYRIQTDVNCQIAVSDFNI